MGVVKTYVDEHEHAISGKARMLKQGVIARLFRDEARRRPTLRWTDIKDEIMMRYTISVSKWICQKARRLAFDMVIQTQREQFAKLWDYEAELQRSNKDIHTEIVTIPQDCGKQQFDKFYICFENMRRTWKECCRPIVGLDGAFLKWELKGEILAAVGRDADNRIYPIAWAIVRVEDNDSWAWFVEHLKTDLGLGLGSLLTVISDKKKGLINVVADLLPQAEHRHCARHIYANWRKVYSDYSHESYFWAIAYSSTNGDYRWNMDALRLYDPQAHDDLLKTDPRTWCRAFFSTHSRCEDVSNNLCESFNRTIRDARNLPVINMLEEVRRTSMKRIAKLCGKTMKCETRFPPKIMEILEGNRKSAKFCSVLKSSENIYEVPDKRKKRGRPKKFDRIKEPGESATNPNKLTREGKTVTCSNCKEIGHNKGTCKKPTVQSAPPRKRGRPRKSMVRILTLSWPIFKHTTILAFFLTIVVGG